MNLWDWLVLCAACAVVLALFLFALFGCAPPQQQLHGVAAFDAWQRANVKLVAVNFGGIACDRWENGLGILYVDLPCMANHSYGNPAWVDFQLRHGQGHAVDFRVLGFARGVSNCNALTCKSFEESAQCIAEVVTGTTIAQAPALGYWDCPDAEVERFRVLMVTAGVW